MRCEWKTLLIFIMVAFPLGVLLSSFSVFPLTNNTVSLVLSSFSFDARGRSNESILSLSPDERSKTLKQTAADSSLPSVIHQDLLTPSWRDSWRKKELPPLSTFKLTRDLVAERVKNDVILVTFGNHAYMGFILNWVKHLTDMGLFNILVGAMDSTLLEALYWKGVPVFIAAHMNDDDLGWGSLQFGAMARERIVFLEKLLQFDYEILLSDTDVVWMKNPLPYFARYPDADLFTSTDELKLTVVDDSLERGDQIFAAYNVGIMHWRPTNSSRNFMATWRRTLLEDNRTWDQGVFNDIMRRKLGPLVAGEEGVVYAFDGTLKLGVLPSTVFCSGQTYFVQAMPARLHLQAYAVHTTFQYGGIYGKRHRLREGMLYHDPPEYYDAPGGFLAFNPGIPKSLFIDDPQTVEAHFNLVNFQMKNIRTAMAIATILGRTLVMPPLWCRFERLHYPHPGITPGSVARPPFICPMDHVFEMTNVMGNFSEEEFGPNIDIREYSFLENPSLPKHVKQSWLHVDLCQEGTQDCQPSNAPRHPGILRFPANSSEETMKAIFASFRDVKVVFFSSMQDALHGFSEEGTERKFRNRVKKYVGSYCCVQGHIPGHIYYDMYWDEKKDWKPEPPKTRQDDHPPF